MKRKNLRRIISIVLCMCIMITMIPNAVLASEADFTDVKNYYPFNKWAVETGKKYSFIFLENNTREVTRAEVANIVFNILDIELTNTNYFSDIKDVDEIKRKSIEAVSSANIIVGYEDGTFRPFNNVTRAEFVTILDRSSLYGNKNSTVNISFNDIDSHWGKESILKIAKFGIVNGKENNNFCPNDTITPQEIFVILDRLVSNNVISKEQLLNAMLKTFKCKVYSDKERFIAEEIYGSFEEVQSELLYSWPYTDYYNPYDWQALVTYEDLQYAIFFSKSNYTKITDEDSSQMLYNNVIKASYLMQGLEADNTKYGKNNVLLKNIYRAFKTEPYYYYAYNEKAIYYADQSIQLNFTNLNEFTNEDLISAKGLINDILDEEYFKQSRSVYLPLDAPVTKHILNYYILKLRKKHNWYGSAIGGYNKEIETDSNNIPSNYSDYPFIVKGIPKGVYEKPCHLGDEFRWYNTPKKAYTDFFSTGNYLIVSRTNDYFNQILNVDYQNTDFNKFREEVNQKSYFSSYKLIDEYIQYVKDNEIVLKGKAITIPGSCYNCDPYAYVRVWVTFEVVNAKTDKNLVFGDTLNAFNSSITYPHKQYDLVLDIVMNADIGIGRKKFDPKTYMIMASDICGDSYTYDISNDGPIMRPKNY